ncbi:hypothetical protein KC315_g8732, partial [Hortaea werneckii]
MAYQGGGGGYGDEHRMHDLPPGGQPYHAPPPRDSDDEEQNTSLLHQGPFQGPFDDPGSRGGTPGINEPTGYQLEESYVGASAGHAPPYNGYGDTGYHGTTLSDTG